jgi:uncharacterized protein (DUF2236 family)
MAAASALTALRDVTGSALRDMLAEPGTVPAAPTRPHDGGLFGPESVTWRVHSHLSVLVGGFRSLLLQSLHPLAMAGVADHSRYRSDPLGRLRRTGAFIATTTFGNTQEAEEAVRAVRRVHLRVKGTAPDGRTYAANDPDLLAWVHYVEVESFLEAYNRLGPGLSRDDGDRYVVEMSALGRRLGVCYEVGGAAELHHWVRHHPERRAGPEARSAARFLLSPPLPAAARAPYAVLLAGAISLLPLAARWQLGLFLPGPVGGRVACEPAARALVGFLGWAMGPSPALTSARQRLGLPGLSS